MKSVSAGRTTTQPVLVPLGPEPGRVRRSSSQAAFPKHAEGHAGAGRSESIWALKGQWERPQVSGSRCSERQVWPTVRAAAQVLGVLVGRTQLSLPARVRGPDLSLLP